MLDLEELYQSVILDHSRRPRNRGVLPQPCQKASGDNPACGDEVTIYLRLDLENKIEAIQFEGQGCAISQASASLMTVKLKGKTIPEAHEILTLFQNHLTAKTEEELPDTFGNLKALAGVRKFPQRVKCATLAWNALKQILQEQEVSPSTPSASN
ncbi:MAG: SUF system NifU family Fe-S cluster assembly protein [Blastochloris sp.]|nr:SUF system NifU family Fe-S cluster assembly protein [Blastochloris sp.]